MLAVRLDPDLEERLTIMAKRSGRSKSDFVRRAIEDRIDEMECIALLEEAMRDPDAGKATISLEQMRRELGLDA
jgi:RHH-type transcriptional regulator, rel operon repressor / antitoxin RelB